MTLAISAMKECVRTKKAFKYGLYVHSYDEAQRVLNVWNKLSDSGKKWFERADIDVMIYYGNMIGEPVPKSPRELKRERGIALRAKREAKRVAQVCS
jgi:hypothetical protein